MKKCFVLLGLCTLILLAITKGHAISSDPVDSLLHALKITPSDTSKASILIELARLHKDTDPQKELDYGRKAFQLAKKAGNRLLQARALFRMGYGYMDQDKLAEAKPLFNASLQHAIALNKVFLITDNYNALGVLLGKQGLYDSAEVYFQKSLQLSRKSKDVIGESIAYLSLTNVGILKGDYSKAITYCLQGIQLAEKTKDLSNKTTCLIQVGTLYFEQGNLEKAEEALLEAVAIGKKRNDQSSLSTSLSNLGVVYQKRRDYKKALLYYTQAQIIEKELGVTNAATLANIGDIYLETKQFHKAEAILLEGLQVARSINDQRNMISALDNLGIVYNNQKDYSRSNQYIHQSLVIAKELGAKPQIQRAYDVLAENYQLLGNYKQALEYHILYTQYKDSVYNETTSEQINKLQIQYETKKKEQQIKSLSQQAQIDQLQLRQQQLYVVALVGLVLILALLGFLLIRQQKLRNEQKTTQLEQRMLRTQMNPHFIFNALMGIQKFILQNNSAESIGYIAKFAKLIRLILENSRQEYISLAKEIQTLEYYCQIQSLRFKNKFDYQIYVDPNINIEETAIPPMFVQPLIENSLEHGMLHKSERGLISVRYILQGDSILLEVEDNGVGLRKASEQQEALPKEHASLASQITKERLAKMGKKAQLSVVELLSEENLVQGTKASMAIPFRLV